MNENAQRWVEALRSGDFDQATGSLRDVDSFCCLGVACELYRREAKKGRWKEDPEIGTRYFHDESGDFADDVLPVLVQRWLGLRCNDGAYSGGEHSLAELNDNGHPFDYIADVIADEPADLFALSPTHESEPSDA